MTLTAHVVAPPRQTTRRAPRPRGRLAPYVFISPALVCLLAFGVLPIIVAGVVSFTNMDIAGLYGSILPAAWSFMLAARARALATAWTTLHLRYERQVAEILGIPYERFTQAALITVGFHTGGNFKPAERIPMEPLVHWDRW